MSNLMHGCQLGKDGRAIYYQDNGQWKQVGVWDGINAKYTNEFIAFIKRQQANAGARNNGFGNFNNGFSNTDNQFTGGNHLFNSGNYRPNDNAYRTDNTSTRKSALFDNTVPTNNAVATNNTVGVAPTVPTVKVDYTSSGITFVEENICIIKQTNDVGIMPSGKDTIVLEKEESVITLTTSLTQKMIDNLTNMEAPLTLAVCPELEKVIDKMASDIIPYVSVTEFSKTKGELNNITQEDLGSVEAYDLFRAGIIKLMNDLKEMLIPKEAGETIVVYMPIYVLHTETSGLKNEMDSIDTLRKISIPDDALLSHIVKYAKNNDVGISKVYHDDKVFKVTDTQIRISEVL